MKGSVSGKRTLKNGKVFYRRDVRRQTEWPLWADIMRLHRKPVEKGSFCWESRWQRIFYDPYYTVAKELALFKRGKGNAAVEVIDLARGRHAMDDLLDNAIACKVLKPDAVLIFAVTTGRSKLGM